MNQLINDKYESLGQDYVTAKLFPPQEHTHTNWAGAVVNARCVVEGIKSLKKCDLAKYLLPQDPGDLAEPGK